MFPYQSDAQEFVDERIRKHRFCPWAVRAANAGEICYIDLSESPEIRKSEEAMRRYYYFLLHDQPELASCTKQPSPVQQS